MSEANQQTKFYRHYKNKGYKVIGTVRHSETLEELVLYETRYENKLGKLWVRPKEMFFENVTIEGVSRARFEKINFRFHESSLVSESELTHICKIYESCFGEKLSLEKFRSKIAVKNNIHLVVAYDGDIAVGFKLGYALDSTTFYSWLGGVIPEYEGVGVATSLMHLQHRWAVQNEFSKIKTKTRARFTRMLSLNIKSGFEIIGTTESESSGIKIVMEKVLNV